MNSAKKEDIIIKPADKASAAVIMNTTDYIVGANHQLLDHRFYEKCDRDLTEFHMNEIHKVVSEMYNNIKIDEKCKNYLCEFTPRTVRFYMLPKIQKPTRPPLGRLIISANGCPTVFEFMDCFLNPLVSNIKSYI